MRHARFTVVLPYELVQRARYIVKHYRTQYSLVGLVTKGLAREVTKAERKHGTSWQPVKRTIKLIVGRRKNGETLYRWVPDRAKHK
jgi:hypothetical protein